MNQKLFLLLIVGTHKKNIFTKKHIFVVCSPILSLCPTIMGILTNSILHDYHKF